MTALFSFAIMKAKEAVTMKFGEKLKQARTRADMTQEAVAKEIGVSRQSLSNWENDRTYPDLASVLKLSDLYGLSLDDLLREDMELRRRMDEVMAQCEGVVLRTDFLAAEREGLLTVTMLAECEEEIGRTVERDGQTGRVYGENSSRSEE